MAASKITKASFAALAGVKAATVSASLKRKKLVESPEGLIDTAHPINRAYLEAHGVKNIQAAQDVAKPKKKKRAEIEIEIASGDDEEMADDDIESSADMGALTLEKLKAEIRHKREATEAYRIKRLATLGTLVELDAVRKTMGQYNAEHRIRLLELPGTVAPRLVATVRGGGSEIEVAALLEDEIARAVDSALDVIRRAGIA